MPQQLKKNPAAYFSAQTSRENFFSCTRQFPQIKPISDFGGRHLPELGVGRTECCKQRKPSS